MKKGKQGFENAFMKILDTYMLGGTEKLSDVLEQITQNKNTSAMIDLVAKASSKITVPHNILMLNPNVSAYRQQEMLNYMKQRIDDKGVLYLIPPHPMQKWEKIENDYIRLFIRFGKYFKKVANTRYLSYDARLALRWMRGSSYAELLADRIKYKKTKITNNREPNVNTEARELFKK